METVTKDSNLAAVLNKFGAIALSRKLHGKIPTAQIGVAPQSIVELIFD